MEYFFDTDDEGHWYIIPLDKREEWNAWFDSQDYKDGIEPDFVQSIGCHPKYWVFKEPRDIDIP